jgi:hypothetical protein
LLEEDMSEFLIFESIGVLVIISRIGERDDDELNGGVLKCWNIEVLETREFSESCCTATRDRDISIGDEVGEILLWDPINELNTTSPQPSPIGEGVFEISSHIGIELAEDEDDFMIFQYFFEIFQYLFEDRSCSLTPTNNEEVFFITFPGFTPLRKGGEGGLVFLNLSLPILSPHSIQTAPFSRS